MHQNDFAPPDRIDGMMPGHHAGDQRSALLAVAADDGSGLLAAACTGWDRRIPDCPDWNAAELIGHTGAILAWMATIITTGQAVARSDRERPPGDRGALAAWYQGHLARTLAILGDTDPDTPVWTFSSRGDHRVGWWHRRLAVEIAIHRWDAQYAAADGTGTPPGGLNGSVAAAGIGEFLTEFLPGLLDAADPRVRERLGGTLHLDPADPDGARDPWRVDLNARDLARTDHPHGATTIRGSCSDLLLWLTNRHPVPGAEIAGRADVARAWHQLRR
jgi:hypothetical protein